jgi:hypothetical protein
MTCPQERFKAKFVVAANGCWQWTASAHPKGYGQFRGLAGEQYAHRAAYKFRHGEIPFGCEVDHLCKNRGCVNPDHLEAVPHRENMRRSDALMGINSRKTHCLQGHPFDSKNTYVYSTTGRRFCRMCGVQRARRYRHAKRVLFGK